MKLVLDNGKEIVLSKETSRKLEKEFVGVDRHRVPENIWFEADCGGGDHIGIVFENRKQELCAGSGIAYVHSFNDNLYKVVAE